MDRFIINGGRRLTGTLRVSGSKNAALPQLAAALLTNGPVVLRDIPQLADIRNMTKLIGQLGCRVGVSDPQESENDEAPVVRIEAEDESADHAPYDLVRTMRASICVLGPLLAKRGRARVALPGGCAIGQRPVDLHLRGLEALGAEITLMSGDIVATTPRSGRLRGATVFLGGPHGSTVLGTANVLCAATLAEGETVIESAACEPEIVDLARMLTAMGADIEGAGSPRIRVRGVDALSGVDHTVMPDRIEAGTYMCAAAATNGDMTLTNCPLDALLAVLDRLEAVGVAVEPVDTGGDDPLRAVCRVSTGRRLNPIEVTTQVYPGFPTDLQAQLMTLLCLADGNSVVTERIFPDRFLHVAELSRMGAKLFRQSATVVVSGAQRLVGAPVMASDLRASAGLVIAGLAAEGETTVSRVYHLDRGYDRMERRLAALGADIRRESDAAPSTPTPADAAAPA